jgi:hypothetical protein
MQAIRHVNITSPIGIDLSSPKGFICLWYVSAQRTTMPKAAIDKDCKVIFLKIEVVYPLNILPMQSPSSDSSPNKSRSLSPLSWPENVEEINGQMSPKEASH